MPALRAGARRLPLLPMAAFRISSLLPASGSNRRTFLPFPINTVFCADSRFHAEVWSTFSFRASAVSRSSMLFCSKYFCAFLQETQPFLRYAQSIFISQILSFFYGSIKPSVFNNNRYKNYAIWRGRSFRFSLIVGAMQIRWFICLTASPFRARLESFFTAAMKLAVSSIVQGR